MRKTPFVVGEYYHIFNRGVDKRIIYSDKKDIDRFIQSLVEFNVVDPIGSIYENFFRKQQLGNETPKSGVINKKNIGLLVEIIAYCLNPNHFHLILRQVVDKGISEFMKRVGGGYTNYYNEKHERSGSLFQGVFKSVHIDTNEFLLHLSAYVNLNNKVHHISNSKVHMVRSSWEEYLRGYEKSAKNKESNLCSKNIILGQFRNIKEYENFAEDSLKGILERRDKIKGIEAFLLE